jgi:hypothetical protein
VPPYRACVIDDLRPGYRVIVSAGIGGIHREIPPRYEGVMAPCIRSASSGPNRSRKSGNPHTPPCPAPCANVERAPTATMPLEPAARSSFP